MTRIQTSTTCAIAGGGPAGIMLGLLLARAGVDVTVLEKHADFLRDFRGDTVHPSTLQLLRELDLLDDLDALPHRDVRQIGIGTADRRFLRVSLADIPGPHKRIALIPQWDFLTMLTGSAARYPGFRLLMSSEVHGLVEEDGSVRGVRYRDADGEHELRAVLTVAADGRRSTLREAAGLAPLDLGAPMDVLWLRMPRVATDPEGLAGRVGGGGFTAAIDRGDYWQIAYLVPKGSYREIRERGIERLQASITGLLPFLADRITALDGWDKVAFLEVGMDRLPRWSVPGMLCVGDAAHTMSPVGGVGINLAVQDAVAAANLLADPLYRAQSDPDRFTRTLNPALVDRVQRRRELPTRGVQLIQRVIQRQVIARALGGDPAPPRAVTALTSSRAWGATLGRVLMYGITPEHVRTPAR
ncbi:FAD-dependent oxidoreductase [Actinorugispora endophytica]|uniref:2-polyprenyl-6-methoxyphenol hydroxylase-like FAD-dependent oxidoreductase n=1 Tax=Actinorugispora endophytica TaxID=1605990 RepID=A0A4R6UVJ1_9ACTN|nr:FAD-dependent oxidoreductase [Actinorugispora endophytica]TDQ51408.1 2-polyprenyl-6-methoxyphenol hydroxylase-like FAD-dependent oxidoreductase [Actinorugispora endophytica]